MKKRIIGLLVILGIFVTMLGLIIGRAEYVFSSKKFYDEEEMKQQYNDGYDRGAFENRDEALYEKLDKCIIENFELKVQNESLQNDNSEKQNIIDNNLQTIETLNNQIGVLNSNAEENAEAIAELTAMKKELENQNNIYAYQISQNNAIIEENNAKIEQLQNSITYYENYIANLENETEVVAIFVIGDEVINIQKVNKNGLAYLENQPEDTEQYTFNGWLVNGQKVDLTTYKLGCNTTFVADLTYKYSVNFVVEENEEFYDTQIVNQNSFASEPEIPIKENYSFVGWSLDKVNIVNVSEIEIVRDTTFYAVFEVLHNTFVELSFNNSSNIKYDNVWFDGEDIYCYYSRYLYKLDKETDTWNRFTFNNYTGYTSLSASNIWTDGNNIYSSSSTNQYVLDKETNAWVSKRWYGLTSFNGNNIWTDGIDYYCYTNSKNYKLNKETDTWNSMGSVRINYFRITNIWTDGVNCYYSDKSHNIYYILDRDTFTWNSIVWNGFIPTYSHDIWTDGVNCYYSHGSEHYVLDKDTNTWNPIVWNGIDSFYGYYIYKFGDSYYYFNGSESYQVIC